MKLISISMSNECLQSPQCFFCYLPQIITKLNLCQIRKALEKLGCSCQTLKTLSEKPTICLEYNGYNLSQFFKYEYYLQNFNLTMTTMPLVITDIFCGAMKKCGIKAISLSYDSQKIKSPQEWFEKAQIIKNNNIKLGCNFLIEKIPFGVPTQIIKISDQLNFLSLKPFGKYKEKELNFIQLKIEQLKPLIFITVDNCLGVQLGYIERCGAGKDFIHILPSGKIEKCCFKEKCFLYKT